MNEGIKLCLYCGKPIPLSKYRLKNQVCNQVCRKAYTQQLITEENRIAMLAKEGQKKHNRKCKVCGKDCYPNYFFCKIHSHTQDNPFDF